MTLRPESWPLMDIMHLAACMHYWQQLYILSRQIDREELWRIMNYHRRIMEVLDKTGQNNRRSHWWSICPNWCHMTPFPMDELRYQQKYCGESAKYVSTTGQQCPMHLGKAYEASLKNTYVLSLEGFRIVQLLNNHSMPALSASCHSGLDHLPHQIKISIVINGQHFYQECTSRKVAGSAFCNSVSTCVLLLCVVHRGMRETCP